LRASVPGLRPSHFHVSIRSCFPFLKTRFVASETKKSISLLNTCWVCPCIAAGQSPLKGGDPAAPSGTATLLRLSPSYQSYLKRASVFGYSW